MQIVINIDSYVLEHCKRHVKEHYANNIEEAIEKGVLLPKGHGRLIDADELLEYGACPNDCNGITTCMKSYEHLHCPIRVFDIESINDAPTIIEADKENE